MIIGVLAALELDDERGARVGALLEADDPEDVADGALTGGREDPAFAGLGRDERERDELDDGTEDSTEDESADDTSDDDSVELSDDPAEEAAAAEEADDDLAFPGLVRAGFDNVPPDDFEFASVVAFLAALLACCI